MTTLLLVQSNPSGRNTSTLGDGLRDMQAAIGSGLNFIGVETGMDSEELRLSGVKTYPTIGHINSLVKAP